MARQLTLFDSSSAPFGVADEDDMAAPATPGRPMLPLDFEGIPGPGPDFVAAVEAIIGDPPLPPSGRRTKSSADEWAEFDAEARAYQKRFDSTLQALYERALYDPSFSLKVRVKGALVPTQFLPGHRWQYEEYGPAQHSDVMVIGKRLGVEELSSGYNFSGKSSDYFYRALNELGLTDDDYADWYTTTVVKHGQVDPSSDTISGDQIKNCRPLLAMELSLVRPKYILCLGVEAGKAVLNKPGKNKGITIVGQAGRFEEVEIPYLDDDGKPAVHVAKVMVVTNPASVFYRPEQYNGMLSALAQFNRLRQEQPISADETDIRHVCIYSERQLAEIVDEIVGESDGAVIAVDCEWHGKMPSEPGAYLRTVQFSHKAKQAFCVVLRSQGGVPAFRGGLEGAARQLNRLLKRSPGWEPRVGGHFFRADLPWLIAAGVDIREEFEAPRRVADGKLRGGWDTGYMAHAYREAADTFKLEVLAAWMAAVPRYDGALQSWKTWYCARHKMKDAELDGYGECPDYVLHPYACLHADSLVQLGDGSWEKISKLVADRYAGTVKAFLNGEVRNCRVTNWHRRDVGQKEWFIVRTATTQSGRWGWLGPKLTPDHKVLTQRGKVPVSRLRPGVDKILTDEREFSPQQLSVFLGSLLGDGGFTRQNRAGVGFGFSQRPATGAYADWKAEALATHNPARRPREDGYHRYELPFSRYLAALADRFPTKPVEEHGDRKARITGDLLGSLGMLGLAVWYQDDGTLVTDKRDGRMTSRIYCRIDEDEEARVVFWLSENFGRGVTYNRNGGFIQISLDAFGAFHEAIGRYVHPAMAYKTPGAAATRPCFVRHDGRPFYETIIAVAPGVLAAGRRGHGVRYCLTVEHAGNFLTKAGFVSNCYDADATRRLYDVLHGVDGEPGLLDADEYGNSSRKAVWLSQIPSLAFLEMEMTGVTIDRVRADDITRAFVRAKAVLEEDFKAKLNWPDFNPNSAYQCRDWLFGSKYNGKKTPDGSVMKLRPKACRSIGLTPIKAAGAKGKIWSEVIARGEEAMSNPSTDKESLGILMHSLVADTDKLGPDGKPAQELTDDGKLVRQLRDIRFLSQVLKGVLRKPMEDDGGDLLYDEDGNLLYDGGLLRWIDHDGRVRTHFYPVETGRCSSSRPNLQNISKRRESDYARILGTWDAEKGRIKGDYGDVFGVPLYKHKIRTMVAAAPGCVLIEADFKMAEMAMIGWIADDPAMIEHVRLNTLPEDHPDYLDLHSLTAITAFRLDTPENREKCRLKGVTWKASKAVLKALGLEHLRVAAKNVNFGVPYQRSAEAIARQCREEGVSVTVAEAQELIDNYYATYPRIAEFLEKCKQRASRPGWLMGPMGRVRRFQRTNDRQIQAEMERQACNLPIQNGVAEAINLACRNLMRYRAKHTGPETFRMCLQIHDALLFEVPIPYIDWFVDEVLPDCMSKGVHIRPKFIDGTTLPIESPYHLDIDTEVFLHWGEEISAEDGERLGIPASHCAKPKPKPTEAGTTVAGGQKIVQRRIR